MATTNELYSEALKNRVSTAPSYQWKDGQMYETARFEDNTLWTVNTATGKLVWNYYDESQRDAVKQSLMAPVNNNQISPATPKNVNLYDQWMEWIQKNISDVWQQYTSAVWDFNKSTIADSVRLRTGWTKDVDTSIAQLKTKLYSSRPELMKKYADITDPKMREQLISQEISGIRNELSSLEAVREYRIWTIQDMIEADINSKEQVIKWLEAQYNLYKDVMWDLKEADKTKREIEKQALEMEKSRMELEAYRQMTPLKLRETQLWLNVAEQNAGVQWQEWTPTGDYYSKFRVTQNYGASSPNSKDNVLLANWQTGTPGIDLAMPENSNVIAFSPGKVISVKNAWDYGIQVVVQDAQWNQHMYSHLNGANVKVWDTIQAGQNIAKSWNTWFSTGPHLDYRVKSTDGKWQDPNTYIWQKTWYQTTWTPTSSLFDSKGKVITSKITDKKTFLEAQKNSSEDISKDLTPNQINKIAEEDLWKFELADTILNEKTWFSKISPEIYDKYVFALDVDTLKNWTDEDAWDYLYNTILSSYFDTKTFTSFKWDLWKIWENLSDNDKKEIKKILDEASITEKEKFKPSSKKWALNFNDSKYYDDLQELWIY